jgi:hypothetical protein
MSWLDATDTTRAMDGHPDFDDEEIGQQFAIRTMTENSVQWGAATLLDSGSLRRDTPMFPGSSGFEGGRLSNSYNIGANPFDDSASAEDLRHLQAAANEHGVLDSEFRGGEEAQEQLDRDAAEAELHGSLNGISMGAEKGVWEESGGKESGGGAGEGGGDDIGDEDSDDGLRQLPKTLSYTTPHHLGTAHLRPAEGTPHSRIKASGVEGTPNFDGHSSRLGALDGNISGQDRPHFGLANPPRTPHGYDSAASSSAGGSPEFSSSRRFGSLHVTSHAEHSVTAQDDAGQTNASESRRAYEPDAEDTHDFQYQSTARRDSHASQRRSLPFHWSDSRHSHEGKGPGSDASVSASMAQFMADETALGATAARQNESVHRESFQSNAASDTTVRAPDESATESVPNRRLLQHSTDADLPALHEGPLARLLFEEVSDLGSFATRPVPSGTPLSSDAPRSRVSSAPAERVSKEPSIANFSTAAPSGSRPSDARSGDREATPAAMSASSGASGLATPGSTGDSLQNLMEHDASEIAQHLLSESPSVSVASLAQSKRWAAQQAETTGAIRTDTSAAQLLGLLDATASDAELAGTELSLAQENLASLSALLGISRAPLDASRHSALLGGISGRFAGPTAGADEKGTAGSARISVAASVLPSPSEFSLGQVDDDLNDLSAVMHGRPAPTQAPVPAPTVDPLLTVQERHRLEREAKHRLELEAKQRAAQGADAGGTVGTTHPLSRSFAAAAHSRSAFGASVSHVHEGGDHLSHSRHTQHESTPDVTLDREDKSLVLQPLEAVARSAAAMLSPAALFTRQSSSSL